MVVGRFLFAYLPMLTKLLKFADDILVLIGCVVFVRGVSLICVPAAWMVAGAMCIAGGFLYGRTS